MTHSSPVMKVGTDICSVKRITQAYERFGHRFMERILTPQEIAYVTSRKGQMIETLAGRFAAKEAAAKALGTGWRGIGWKEVEIVRHPSGAPQLVLHGRASKRAEALGLTQFEISLSHEREFATAFVLAYGNV
jgi:holo-[acyl-carrier protein] synthase